MLNGVTVGTGKLDETWFNTYVSSSISQFAGTSSFATTSSYTLWAENAVIVSGANKQLYISSLGNILFFEKIAEFDRTCSVCSLFNKFFQI